MPRKRRVSEDIEEARQLPYGERAELIEQLIADSAIDLDPKIEKPGATRRCAGLLKWKVAQSSPFPGRK